MRYRADAGQEPGKEEKKKNHDDMMTVGLRENRKEREWALLAPSAVYTSQSHR